MRKPTTELFYLIKSMTKGEKLVFKQLAKRHRKSGKTNYIRLYELIEQQSKYDEAILKEKASPFLNIEYFAHDKNNLYQLIRQALFFFHSGKSVDGLVIEHLSLGKILFDKQLYSSSWKEVKSAKKLVLDYELVYLEMQCVELQKKLVLIVPSVKTMQENLTLIKREYNLLEKVENLLTLKEISGNLFYRYFQHNDNNKELTGYINKVKKHPLLINYDSCQSFAAKWVYFEIQGIINFSERNFEKTVKAYEDLILLYESNTLQLARTPKAYIYSMNNLAQALSLGAPYEKVAKVVDKINIALDNPEFEFDNAFKIQPRINIYIVLTNSIIRHKKFEYIEDYLQDIEKTLKKSEYFVWHLQELALFNNIAYCLFALGEYRKALHWVNKVLNNREMDKFRGDYHCYSRMLNILIHYELGHHDLIDYIISTSTRFLKQKEAFGPLEEMIFTNMATLSNMLTEKEKKVLFKSFLQKMYLIRETLFKDAKIDIIYFLVCHWLENKLGKTEN